MPRSRRPPGCTQEVYDAIDVFTDKEIDSFFAAYADDTGEFIGIRFTGPDGKACKFGDPIKFAALDVLEKQYKEELLQLNLAVRKSAIKSISRRLHV